MAINLGTLELAITAAGTQGTLRDIAAVDGAAQRAGRRGAAVPVSAPGAGQAAREVTAVGTAAGKSTKGISAFGAAMKGTFAALGINMGLQAVVSGIRAANAAFDANEQSQRKLAATSRITGAPLATLAALSQRAQTEFRLSAVTANDFAIEVSKLAAKAGDLSLASDAMQNFLNIGAARGFSPAQTLEAIQQAILGIDEGTDKLFNANPSVLYAQYAAQIGTTAGKLTDQQKAQALVTAAAKDGAKVQGELAAFYETAAGRAFLLDQAQTKLGIAFGTAILPIREMVVTYLTGFTDWIVANQPMIVTLGKIVGGALAISFRALGMAVLNTADAVAVVWDAMTGGIMSAAEKILGTIGRLIGGFARLAGALGLDSIAASLGGASDTLLGLAARAGASADTRFAASRQHAGAILGRTISTAGAIGSTLLGRGAGTSTAPRAAGGAGAAAQGTAGGTGTGGGSGGTGTGSTGRSLPALFGQGAPGLGTVGLTSAAVALKPVPLPIAPVLNPGAAVQAILARTGEIQAGFQTAARSLGDLFSNAFGAAFEGGMSSAGDMLIGGLGSIMVSFGQALVPFGALMEKFAAAVTANPILAGPVGIAAGLALIALGSALRGAARGGGRGGGGGGGRGGAPAFGDQSTTIGLGGTGAIGSGGLGSGQRAPVRTGADARAATLRPVQINATIIGTNDPQAGRALAQMVDKHRGRGA